MVTQRRCGSLFDCTALQAEGLTTTVHVMIRPRPGDFCYRYVSGHGALEWCAFTPSRRSPTRPCVPRLCVCVCVGSTTAAASELELRAMAHDIDALKETGVHGVVR